MKPSIISWLQENLKKYIFSYLENESRSNIEYSKLIEY